MLESYAFTAQSFEYLAAGLVIYAVAAFVCYRKCRDRVTMLLVLGFFCMASFCFSSAMMAASTTIPAWRAWRRVYVLSDLTGVCFVFHFTHLSRLGGGLGGHRRVLAVYSVPLLFVAIFAAAPGLIIDPVVEMEGSPYGRFISAHRSGPLSAFRYLYLGAMLLMILANFFRMFRQGEDPALRRRMAYFVLASLFPLIGLLVPRVADWVFGVTFSFNVAVTMVPIVSVVMAYGIVKEHLFDINLVVKKSILYTIFTTILAGAFVGIEKVVEILMSSTVLAGWDATVIGGVEVSKAVTSGAVLLVSVPAKRASDVVTDRLFPDIVESALSHMTPERVLDLYREELRIAWRDGTVSAKEREMLDAFRRTMHIPDEQQARLETEARWEPAGGRGTATGRAIQH